MSLESATSASPEKDIEAVCQKKSPRRGPQVGKLDIDYAEPSCWLSEGNELE